MPNQPDFLEHIDDADPIEHSPLEREVTRDGATVRIFIYRGRADPGWLLEIEDELGGSTVWDDPFDSDQAALDEALQTIDEDGIHSFAEQHSDQAADRALWDLAISQPAITELKRILASSNGAVDFHRLCGVFAAVVTTPEPRHPSEWLELAQGDHVFENLEDAQVFTNGMMALYNEVLRSVTEQGAHCCPPPEDHDAVREFCAGYVTIAINDPTWFQDAPALAKLLPMCGLAGTLPPEQLNELAEVSPEDPERWLQRARETLPQTVESFHVYWAEERLAAAARLRERTLPQRRASPKVGRNERCPCGSGKKFKKCCG